MRKNFKLFVVLIFLIAINTVTVAQIKYSDVEIIKTELNKNNPDIDYYTAILPKNRVIDDYIILLTGFGETTDGVLNSTSLPYDAVKRNTAVFIPILHKGAESYGFTEENQRILTRISEDIRQRYSLQNKEYFIGGFSMGGTAALKFVETTVIKPSKVFLIDSPLDLERFYYSLKRDVEVYKKGLQEKDSTYLNLLSDMRKIMNGEPEENYGNYKTNSPYLLSDTNFTAIIPLKSIPVRIYIEPNEQWWLDNRQTDVLGLNILDVTAFINDLRLIGNKEAELIVTHNKGFRKSTQTYHPHSWTIVDNEELLHWLKEGK